MGILLYNARVRLHGEYEWVEVEDGRISRLGSGEPPKSGRGINLRGALLLPGFCDSHTHLSNIAMMLTHLNLTGLGREEMMHLVKRRCQEDRVVVGRGWDESLWDDKRFPTVDELDSICKDKPVLLIREDGHVAVGNSRMLSLLGLEESLILEEDVSRALKMLNLGKGSLRDAQDYALRRGVTCVHDFAGMDTFREYLRMRRDGELRIRVYANFYLPNLDDFLSLGFYSGFGDDYLRVGGVKIFADGSIGAGNAATRYADGRIVKPLMDAGEIRKIVLRANAGGIRVFTHAIGDLAIDGVLEAYRGTRGNRIEHLELVREEHIPLLRGMEASMQPNFLKWAKEGGLYHRMLGREWLERNNPYRELISSGMKLLFGSDCMPLDPQFGIRMATESEYGAQRIGLEEAVRAYTQGSKYLSDKLGELERGYLADLVAIEDFPRGKVIMTMVGGKIMWSSPSL